MKPAGLPRFSAAELLFSLKAFGAAMLAFYLASRAGLPRPFWALMTAYVVAHPLAGAVRSKGLYRLAGTLVGSAAAVLLVPRLAHAPELLSLALALWVALCLFLSLRDRTPRSYAFMLAGYTAALIGFPTVDTPLAIFDTAVARVEEIGLGILAATLVHSLVLPTGLQASVLGLLDRSLGDTRRWLTDLLARRDAGADRQRVAGDITQLRLLSTHIPFDTGHLRWTAGAVHQMQDRIAALTPLLSAVEDRLQALEQAEGGLAPDLQALLVELQDWLAQAQPLPDTPTPTQAGGPRLAALRARLPELAQGHDPAGWSAALRIALAQRLDELLQGWQDCLDLRRDIDAGLAGAAMPQRDLPTPEGARLHLDLGMAALSGAAALVAILICCAFWILSGWPMGSAAAMMAAIFCCFFAGMDDPVPAIQGFLTWTLWSMPVSALYVLVLLPLVQDVATLALVCAPLFLLAGAFIARPATMGKALPLLFGVIGSLALHDTAQADFTAFLNAMLGQILGVVVAARVTGLMRSVGADWSARRIQRATWQELDELAAQPRSAQRGQAYLLRMLDRIALLAPRVAQAGGRVAGVPTDEALRDLRLGADLVALQQARRQRRDPVLAPLLAELRPWLRRRAGGRLDAPPATLLARIDQALARIAPRTEAAPLTSALVGLRRNLFPAAAPLAAAPEFLP